MAGWSQRPQILASDAERERSIGLLKDAVVRGRLTLEEFSDRVGMVQVARMGSELAALTADLPPVDLSPSAVAAVGHRAVCSRLVRSGAWEPPPHFRWRSVFGTIDLDLRRARLAGPETELEIFNLFGTVTVIVPSGVMLEVHGGGRFATKVIDAPIRRPAAQAPVVRIRTSGLGGTIRVRSSGARQWVARLVEHARSWDLSRTDLTHW
jgi:Domain of unknown function (DUF1707)